jgi:GNAT superfamily N-acetyltransferase
VHPVTEEEPLAMQIVGAAEIDELLERGLASLLSRAYTDQRHLDSYSIAELSRWSDGLRAMGADPVAAMPREWLTRFPTMRNLWRPAESRIGSVHFLERVDGRVIGHVALFEHEFQLGNEAGVRAGYIEDVATSPSALGTGVASRLMQAAAAHATDTGYEVMGLSTGIPKFYARLGWVVWRGSLRTWHGTVMRSQTRGRWCWGLPRPVESCSIGPRVDHCAAVCATASRRIALNSGTERETLP